MFNISTQSLLSVYKIDEYLVKKILMNSKKKVGTPNRKNVANKRRILKDHHKEFLIKYIEENKHKYDTVSSV